MCLLPSVLRGADQSLMFIWKCQLVLPTTAQPQHSRPYNLTGRALGAYWRAPDTQVMARKLASRVSRNAPFLPSKQAHALSPLGANFHPFVLLWWVWFDPEPIWEQKNWWNSDQNLHFYTHATFLAGKWHKSSPPLSPLTPNSLIWMQVLHVCIETIGWPHMCNSGKGHQFPLFGWGMAILTESPKVADLVCLTALKSASLHIRAEPETCQLKGPYPRSMQKVQPFWASDKPLRHNTTKNWSRKALSRHD